MTTHAQLSATEVTIFKDYVRLDLQTRTPGISFADVWSSREVREYDGRLFFILSKADLIASKKAAGGDVDLQDVSLLEGKGSES